MTFSIRLLIGLHIVIGAAVFISKANAFPSLSTYCHKLQASGPIELETQLNNQHFKLKTFYKLMPLPLIDEPRRVQIFKSLNLTVNGKRVLISPASVEPLMALFGYSGKIHTTIQQLPSSLNTLMLDQNLKITSHHTGVHVSSIYIEESNQQSCY